MKERKKTVFKKKNILCRSSKVRITLVMRYVLDVSSRNYIVVFLYVCFRNWSRSSNSSIMIKLIIGRRRVQQADENDKRKWNRKKERKKKRVEEEDKLTVIDGGRKILISTPRCFLNNGTES